MNPTEIWKTLETTSDRNRYSTLNRQLKRLWWRAFRFGAAFGCIGGFGLWYAYMAVIHGGLP